MSARSERRPRVCGPHRARARARRAPAQGVPVGQGDGVRGGCGLAGADPVVQARDGGLQHVVVLGGEIDAVRQARPHQLVRRRVRRDDVVQRCASVVDEADTDRVVVGVGGAGNLPHPQPFVVGPARVVIAEQVTVDQIGFGDDRQHRDPQVVPKRRRTRLLRVRCRPRAARAGPNRECTRKPSKTAAAESTSLT